MAAFGQSRIKGKGMDSPFHRKLKALLYPYAFVLKEGKDIKRDYLDYSLTILQLDCVDMLPSPKPKKASFKGIDLPPPLMRNSSLPEHATEFYPDRPLI